MTNYTAELFAAAEKQTHRQFQFLRSWGEYSRARKIRKLLQLTVNSIDKTADRLFNKYCKTVRAGRSDFMQLLAYQATDKILWYWVDELRIITDMIEEYEAYLAAGNFWKSLFGDHRAYDQLEDYRGK